MRPLDLPYSPHLPVELLASVFSDVTNSYKYYWLLAILEHVKKGNQKIHIHDLIIEMIGEVWYPINYFRLSFGKSDKFDHAAQNIKATLDCSKDIKKDELIDLLHINKDKQELKDLIHNLSRYVPTRFLTPWFRNELRGLADHKRNPAITELADRHFKHGKNCLYRFTDNRKAIEISDMWFRYLSKHLNVLAGFTEWHLVNFLQKNNPNVPNIPVKLFPPEKRELKNARKYWNIYFNNKEHVYCPYSGKELTKHIYSIDHFLPWSFVGHDQLWNLAPTLQEVNSSKSDQLPSETYLEKFVNLQFDAFHTALNQKSISKKLLEDYTVLFKRPLNEIHDMSKNRFTEKLKDMIHPQIQVAGNMGFGGGWRYY
jgi:hypothetical protein